MVNYLDKFSFDGKIAYVVGGAGLIGREAGLQGILAYTEIKSVVYTES